MYEEGSHPRHASRLRFPYAAYRCAWPHHAVSIWFAAILGRELLDAVLSTLRGDGSVLLPVDSAGRVLELILLLERHW